MFWVVFGLYTIFVAGIWITFLIARMHAFKFRNYSFHIVPVVRALGIGLLLLTIVGYYFVFTFSSDMPSFGSTVKETVRGQIY